MAASKVEGPPPLDFKTVMPPNEQPNPLPNWKLCTIAEIVTLQENHPLTSTFFSILVSNLSKKDFSNLCTLHNPTSKYGDPLHTNWLDNKRAP